MGTIAYKSDDEYSTISEKGDIGFVDFDKYKSACSYNPNEESNIVVISVPFPLIGGKPKSGFVGERVVDSVTIENTTNETQELWSIKIYDSKPEDSFTLSLMKPPTDCSDVQYVQEFMESFSLEDRMLRPGQKLIVWLTCKPKEIGLHTSAVHFNVGDDTIERLVFVLAEDKVSQSLASSRPFHRERRKKVPAVDVSAANGIVVGSRPTRASNRGFRCRLPSYPIPEDLREMIEQKQFPDVIGEGLRRDNYIAYFRTLLAIEEIKMEEDMRDYDMESVTMKRRGPQFLSLDVPGLAEKRPSLVYGDYIIARLATADASEIMTPYQGYIHRVEAEEVYLKFDRDFHINHVAGNLYNVQFAFNRTGVRRLHQAIEAAESLNGEVLFPSVIARARNIQDARLAPMSCMLNEEQTSAVEKILGCKGGAPYVIHGPPGTGKTRTLIEAIIQLHIMGKDARVLICAPSNSAADHILEKLVGQQNVKVQDHEILRLNALTRPLDDVNPSYVRFCNVEDNGFKCPLLRDLRRYRIIISTYASASLLYAEGIKRGHFSHIFLDEAGQASEPETMIPLSHLLMKETVVVLAGDPRQLGPIVFSKDAENYGLGTSYMERLFECKLYGALNENYATRLVRNYRCHPIILRLPSEMFYGGELIPCKEDKTSTRTWVDLLPNKEFPLVFIGIQGCDEREGNNPSWFNRIEASKVVEIIRDLIENKGLKMEDIGVITPYRQQVLKIRSALESFDWANIKVGSVEQFQGQEREVIIISTVRSTIQHNDFDRIHYLGFLSNPRRFNVAATRARSLLVVIGNPHIICKDPYWNKLLWYCVDNGSYKGCFLPEKLEIPQEDSRQENNWGCDEAGQANNWCDDGGQVNNWDDDGGQVNNWGGEQAYNWHDDGAQENNWDCGGAQAKSWGCEGAQANDLEQEGGKVNDWDQDEGAQAKNWNDEGTRNNEEKQSLQPSLDVQQDTVHQMYYTLDPVMDEAEWSDGWKSTA